MADKSRVEPSLLVRPAQAAHLLGIGKTLLFQMLKDGRLERRRLGKRAVGVTVASIRAVAEGRAGLPPVLEPPEPPEPPCRKGPRA